VKSALAFKKHKSNPIFSVIHLEDSHCREAGHATLLLLLEVQTLETLGHVRNSQPAPATAQSTGPLPTIFRQSSAHVDDAAQSQAFAIVLQGFNRELAQNTEFVTSAAIMNVTKGVDSYIPYCCPLVRKGIFQKIKEYLDPTTQYISGPYIRPARVQNLGHTVMGGSSGSVRASSLCRLENPSSQAGQTGEESRQQQHQIPGHGRRLNPTIPGSGDFDTLPDDPPPLLSLKALGKRLVSTNCAGQNAVHVQSNGE
jgi:hypothetical protein